MSWYIVFLVVIFLITFPWFKALNKFYEYYFLKSNGDIIYFTEKKKDLLELMRDKYTQIKTFIKEYNLKLDEKGHLARITAYYNGLTES